MNRDFWKSRAAQRSSDPWEMPAPQRMAICYHVVLCWPWLGGRWSSGKPTRNT